MYDARRSSRLGVRVAPMRVQAEFREYLMFGYTETMREL